MFFWVQHANLRSPTQPAPQVRSKSPLISMTRTLAPSSRARTLVDLPHLSAIAPSSSPITYTLIRSPNHRTVALAPAAMRNAPSNSAPKNWHSGSVANRFVVVVAVAPPSAGSGSVPGGGGGNDVRSWMSVDRR